MRFVYSLLLLIPLSSGLAAEHVFDFSAMRENQTPEGFTSALTGQGQTGDWRVIYDAVPPVLAPLSPQAPAVSKRAVVAQLSQDPTDERFPLLVYNGDTYGDFTFSTRFKTVSGTQEQMAGIAFRLLNETNYYVLRASSLGNTFRFYKVVNGQRGAIIGPNIKIPTDQWQELAVECRGNQIRCFLNGSQAIPTITDNSFTEGKVAFWTKSDSVSYFTGAKIVYERRELPAQAIVNEVLERHSRLLGLKLYMAGDTPESTRVVASKDESEKGKPGTHVEADILKQGVTYYGKNKGNVTVTMPVRDRNGDIIAAARVVMRTFPGQTEKNAVERAAPIVRDIQKRVQMLDDLDR